MSYILVNPIIESGAIKSKKKSANDAAEDLWSKYSGNIKNLYGEVVKTKDSDQWLILWDDGTKGYLKSGISIKIINTNDRWWKVQVSQGAKGKMISNFIRVTTNTDYTKIY